MPHQSFGTVRAGVEREPITFDFGLFGEETFTVVPDPSLGDVLDLLDAPEPTPTNETQTLAVLTRFIRRLLPVEDRPRFNQALYRIPITEAPAIVIDCAAWIATQVTGFPTVPPTTFSRGRPPSGASSKPKRAGASRSRR